MLRFLTAGESHGRGIIGIVESFPAGFDISVPLLNRQLARRQTGYGRGKRMQIEKDKVIVLSGLRQGRTIGSPITCLIENKDWPHWRKIMDPETPPPKKLDREERRRLNDVYAPRPGHADLAGAVKYDTHDLRNVLERASARETAARVACGSLARILLEYYDIRIASHVLSIGGISIKKGKIGFEDIDRRADTSPVRCIDPFTSKAMVAEIKNAAGDKDTLGGSFEVRVANLPIGLGSHAQWFMRLDGALAAAFMSIQSVKGVEIGDAMAVSKIRGSKAHDRIYQRRQVLQDRHKNFLRRTNRAGGLEGGITNGSELVVRAYCKPISTLGQPLETVDIRTREKAEAIAERSDVCVVPAAAVIGEAMAAMVLASAFTNKFGCDSKSEIDSNFTAYLNREF
jgi:chorismate synthase